MLELESELELSGGGFIVSRKTTGNGLENREYPVWLPVLNHRSNQSLAVTSALDLAEATARLLGFAGTLARARVKSLLTQS